jgi:hypothetical protein
MLKTIVAATALVLASPAYALLQIAVDIDGDTFTCADGAACDTSPVANLIITNNVTLDGILFASSAASSASGAINFLNVSNLILSNTNATAANITIAVGNTSFTPPVASFNAADSGVWQGVSGASVAGMKWFIDPANTQGANNAFDTPGVQVATDNSLSAGPVLAFSRNQGLADLLSGPFSMTEQLALHLEAGESLVNRGQSIIGSATVPEPSTWVMMGLGFAGLGLAGYRKALERA